MTHSLHRSGDIESLKKDFVWFMYQTKGVNDKNIKPKALEFIAAAEAFGSENWGDVKTGPKTRVPVKEIEDKITDKSRLRGVFTRRDQVVGVLKRIKEKNLGQSVVISGVLSEVIPACEEAGCKVHRSTIHWAYGQNGASAGRRDAFCHDDVRAPYDSAQIRQLHHEAGRSRENDADGRRHEAFGLLLLRHIQSLPRR
jgi:hypothetical protein